MDSRDASLLDRRTVSVRRVPHAAPRSGTGYHLGHGLVLTAAGLVVADDDAVTVQVRSVHDPAPQNCSVVWGGADRTSARQPGAVLLYADSLNQTTSDLPPLRWGRLVTRRPTIPVRIATSFGILRAVIDAGTAVKSQRLLATVDTLDGIPAHEIVGAAVLCHELLVGVVAGPYRSSSDNLWFDVVPLSGLAQLPAFIDAVGSLRMEAAELQPVLADDPLPGDSRTEGGGLHAWLDGADGFSVRLVTGASTARNAAVRGLLASARAEGWAAGVLAKDIDSPGLSLLRDVATGLFLVIEGADSSGRAVLDVLNTIGQHPAYAAGRHDAAPVRLLFSAEAAGDWWEGLRSEALILRDLPGKIVLPLEAD